MPRTQVIESAPTVQQRMEDLKVKFQAIADKVTEDDVSKVAPKMFTSTYTVKRYLKGRIGKLLFGERLYAMLANEVKSNTGTAA